MAKVAHDKFSDEKFKKLYDFYAKDNLELFQIRCIDMIENFSVSSNLKKQEFCKVIKLCPNKDKVVKKMTDFYLAGAGFGVYNPGKKVA